MNDLVPIAIFVGCLLATFGLVRMCEWLRPSQSSTARQNTDDSRSNATSARNGEVAK